MRNISAYLTTVEDDDRKLAEDLKASFSYLDVKAAWERVASGAPVVRLLRDLPSRSQMARWDWEQSSETTREYLEYHFKYALLRQMRDVGSSRYIIGRHLKNADPEQVDAALDFVEDVAVSLSVLAPDR